MSRAALVGLASPDMVGEAHPTKAKPLRDTMPHTAAFVDVCRETFGAEHVNAQIKLGMQGAKTFHAVEGGFEVGTADHNFDAIPDSISLDRMVIRDKQPEEKKNGK